MEEEMSLLKDRQKGGDANRHEPTENFHFMHDEHREREVEHRQQSRHHWQFVPLQVRLMVQFNDGTTREWGPNAPMNEVVQTLRAMMMGSLDNNRENNGSIHVFDHDSVAVNVDADLHDVTAQKTLKMHLPISFFWIDMTGSPELEDLNALFGLLKVNACTKRRWGAEATGGLAGNSSDYTNGGVFEDDSDPFWGSNEEARGREPDEMHVFVEEQYVQLQLAVIRANNPPSAHDATQSIYAASRKEHAMHQPDRLHANLFDVDVEEDLGRVRLLCFSDGIVTWRPVPEVEGWGYIAQAVERRLADPSPTKRMLTTSQLLHIILDELCEAFLPDPTLVLNEADAIDSMLPFVRQRESEQADVLRRSLRLQRRIAVHRRLLLSKVNLLEQLGRPVMRTLLAFITADLGNTGKVLQRPNAIAASKPLTKAPMQTDKRSAALRSLRGLPHTSIIHRILYLLRQLDGAHTILSNATIVYTSTVAMRNNNVSTESDYRMVVLHYVTLIILPLTIVASQWGMNCYVPWKNLDSTTPFWTITGLSALYAAVLLSYPLYYYLTGRPDKLV
ncbi:hypothetical protein MOQ_006584 [Trypanosoma cruzi marinkellei]|uniref:CorA-like Mg2+ transporter protein n=1 Tax=Trypanosoma cruzi marinkellei TaxID=85056 RepID=K2MRG2_TRYCR|nr:hypothetical protein MOQ_006584 [Trypanosoma cruzi marinkellei]